MMIMRRRKTWFVLTAASLAAIAVVVAGWLVRRALQPYQVGLAEVERRTTFHFPQDALLLNSACFTQGEFRLYAKVEFGRDGLGGLIASLPRGTLVSHSETLYTSGGAAGVPYAEVDWWKPEPTRPFVAVAAPAPVREGWYHAGTWMLIRYSGSRKVTAFIEYNAN